MSVLPVAAPESRLRSSGQFKLEALSNAKITNASLQYLRNPQRGDALDYGLGQKRHQPLDVPDVDLEDVEHVVHGVALGADLGGSFGEGEGRKGLLAVVDGVVGVAEQTPIAVADTDADDAIWGEVCELPAAVAELGVEAKQKGPQGVALDADGISVDKS